MTCRLFTPDVGHQQRHMGLRLADGVFSDGLHPDALAQGDWHTRLCIHPDADGLAPAVGIAVVPKGALVEAGEASEDEPKAAAPKAAKPKRRKKDAA